jgi:hypothetical protein
MKLKVMLARFLIPICVFGLVSTAMATNEFLNIGSMNPVLNSNAEDFLLLYARTTGANANMLTLYTRDSTGKFLYRIVIPDYTNNFLDFPLSPYKVEADGQSHDGGIHFRASVSADGSTIVQCHNEGNSSGARDVTYQVGAYNNDVDNPRYIWANYDVAQINVRTTFVPLLTEFDDSGTTRRRLTLIHHPTHGGDVRLWSYYGKIMDGTVLDPDIDTIDIDISYDRKDLISGGADFFAAASDGGRRYVVYYHCNGKNSIVAGSDNDAISTKWFNDGNWDNGQKVLIGTTLKQDNKLTKMFLGPEDPSTHKSHFLLFCRDADSYDIFCLPGIITWQYGDGDETTVTGVSYELGTKTTVLGGGSYDVTPNIVVPNDPNASSKALTKFVILGKDVNTSLHTYYYSIFDVNFANIGVPNSTILTRKTSARANVLEATGYKKLLLVPANDGIHFTLVGLDADSGALQWTICEIQAGDPS